MMIAAASCWWLTCGCHIYDSCTFQKTVVVSHSRKWKTRQSRHWCETVKAYSFGLRILEICFYKFNYWAKKQPADCGESFCARLFHTSKPLKHKWSHIILMVYYGVFVHYHADVATLYNTFRMFPIDCEFEWFFRQMRTLKSTHFFVYM